jgi:hypothetical protein
MISFNKGDARKEPLDPAAIVLCVGAADRPEFAGHKCNQCRR